MFYVYRHFDCDGVLLYVGYSSNLEKRTQAHKAGSRWRDQIDTITSQSYLTRKAALFAEREAILNEHPPYNISFGDTVKLKADNELIIAMSAEGINQRKIGKAIGISGAAVCERIKSYRLQVDSAINILMTHGDQSSFPFHMDKLQNSRVRSEADRLTHNQQAVRSSRTPATHKAIR